MYEMFKSSSLQKTLIESLNEIGSDHPFYPVVFFENVGGKPDSEVDEVLRSLKPDQIKNLLSYAAEMYQGIPLDQLGLRSLHIALNRCFPNEFSNGAKTFMELLQGV